MQNWMQIQAQQQEMLLYQEFQKSPEGIKAQEDAQKVFKVWVDKRRGGGETPRDDSARLDKMEEKLSKLIDMLGGE